ncbi:uncharacterized protein LOC121878559 isoform X3 [Homarus americanus]|uniref:uncharacterized protein LOC121878559 isoform X3 n=1 Tax=Homarus americanus TaxID=6706 RepID=UPI001C472495|nr:uncharacterized protein LOC121878559 isoform X3 [Homarus americanus]
MSPYGMPSSGWLSSITRHFSRTPTLPHAHTGECGPTGGNGIATVSSQDPRNVTQSITPPSRPTTPWSLDTLDDEIQRAHGTTPLTGNGKTSHAYYDTHSGYVAAPSMMEGYGHGSQSYPHSSRPTSAASRPSSAASRPSSGVSRPASAASRLSTPAHSLLRAQTHAQTTAAADSAVPLPQQVDEGELYQSYPGETSMESRGHYYIPPVIPPLYDRPVAAPTPASTRCSTPVWDLDGEKRVRFLEPEVVGDVPSRPSSVNSQYSQVLKNSTRFAFQPSQVGLMLVVVAWWVVGAAIFSTVEGAAESDTVNRMATLRTDLVLGLATELRQVLPYETVWRTKIETYMERLETAVLDAARAGYASRAPTWTMSGALLYSASLTTLVGPSGMTVRTGFSRIFAVLFSLVGAPLVLLLAISGAFTIREGVGKAWAWRCGFGKQARVADGRGQVVEGRAGQYGSGRGGSAASTLNLAGRPQSSTSAGVGPGGEQGVRITPNGPGELPGSIRPPNSAKPRLWGGTADIQQQSRVQALDSTLRSSSILSSTLRDTDHSSSSSATNSVSGSAQNTLSNSSQFRTVGDEQTMGVNPAIQRRGRYPPPPRQGSRRPHGVPWPVYLALLVAYIFLGLAIFAPIQRWSFPSSLYILMSTLMTLDHDSLGEKQQLGSSRIIVPYVVYMLLGLVVMATLVISVWSSICTSLVNTGKYLAVVRPTAR